MISMPTKLDISVLRIIDWPARDRSAWLAATTETGWFDEDGRLARFTGDRLRVLEAAYGRWLGFLSLHIPDWDEKSGVDRLRDTNRVHAYYERLDAVLAPCTVRAYMSDLLTVVRAMVPGKSFEVLHGAVRHIWRTAEPVKDKYARLVPARDLFSLGRELMEGASACNTPLGQAILYRDGLMISMLIACPVRLGNFASIEIDRHIRKLNDAYWLVFPASEVKNRRPLEYRLLPALHQPIERYLDVYRPRLLSCRGRHWRAHNGKAFWISSHGAPLKRFPIRERINRHTGEKFGSTINPHLFRDCAATSIALEDPEHVGIILPVLGHARATTGERYYNLARSHRAAREYQSVVDGLRNKP